MTLIRGEKTLLDLKGSRKTFTVYGCGLLGVLIASALKGQVRSFVDDDPRIQGSRVLELPVLSPDALKGSQAEVIIGVPTHASQAVRRKCDALGIVAVAPFIPDLART